MLKDRTFAIGYISSFIALTSALCANACGRHYPAGSTAATHIEDGTTAPFSSLESPPEISISDWTAMLEGLGGIVGEATVVGLGETHHGSKTLQSIVGYATRFMVERMGFRTIAIETPWAPALEVERFVSTCEGDARSVVLKLFFTERSEEMADFLLWVCEWNRVHPMDQVAVFGIDSSQPYESWQVLRTSLSGALTHRELADLHADLSVCDGVREESAERYAVEGYRAAAARGAVFPTDRFRGCRKAIGYIRESLDTRSPPLSRDVRFLAVRALSDLDLWNTKAYYVLRDRRETSIADDLGMFESFERLRAFHVSEKVVVWAHLGHLAYDHRDVRVYSLHAHLPMFGNYARERYGSDYLVVGVTASDVRSYWNAGLVEFSAPPGSLERSIAHDFSGEAVVLLDLRKYKPTLLDAGGRMSSKPTLFYVGRMEMVPTDQMTAVFWMPGAMEMTPVRNAFRGIFDHPSTGVHATPD